MRFPPASYNSGIMIQKAKFLNSWTRRCYNPCPLAIILIQEFGELNKILCINAYAYELRKGVHLARQHPFGPGCPKQPITFECLRIPNMFN